MRRVANIILELTAWSWVIGITIAIVMTLSSCGSTKKCCIKTANEVYKHEGMYANQEWDKE